MSSSAIKSRRPRGAARREALLDAVLAIVAQRGTDAVTHRRVAEVAELPLASTTYWFESREHLLTAALELAAERDITRLREQAAGGPRGGESPVSRAVRAILAPAGGSSHCGYRSSLITTYALLLEAARSPALREVSTRWTEAYLETIGELLTAAGSQRPHEDAELLLSAADGLLIEQLASGDSTDATGRLERLATALVNTP